MGPIRRPGRPVGRADGSTCSRERDRVADDLDVLRGQWLRRGTLRDGTVVDIEPRTVALADDRAILDAGQHATLVSARRAERLELPSGGLRDHDHLLGKDLAAIDRDVGRPGDRGGVGRRVGIGGRRRRGLGVTAAGGQRRRRGHADRTRQYRPSGRLTTHSTASCSVAWTPFSSTRGTSCHWSEVLVLTRYTSADISICRLECSSSASPGRPWVDAGQRRRFP